jgi:hypothetical protein
LGGVLGSNIYLAEEARTSRFTSSSDVADRIATYHTGFGTSLAVVFVGCVITPGIYWVYLGRVNKKRAGMSEEEIKAKYTPEELEAMGDRSPFYRYER